MMLQNKTRTDSVPEKQVIPYNKDWSVHFNITLRMLAMWMSNTEKNPVISPNFLVWKFCGKSQFPHSFGRFARNYGRTVPFHKIPIPGN